MKTLPNQEAENPRISAIVAVWRLWRQFRKGQGKVSPASSDSLASGLRSRPPVAVTLAVYFDECVILIFRVALAQK